VPKCSRCPVKTECNENPILVEYPTPAKTVQPLIPDNKELKRNPKFRKRLCPLLIAIGYAVEQHTAETEEDRPE